MSFKEVNVNVGGPKKDAPYTYKEVILKPNKSFAEQVSGTDRIYVIKWDFDLGGEEVTIPENCVLKFEGGSLNNGTITGQNTGIKAEMIKIFGANISIAGTWEVDKIYSKWFTLNNTDDTQIYKNLYNLCNSEIYNIVYIEDTLNVQIPGSRQNYKIPSHTKFVIKGGIVGIDSNEGQYSLIEVYEVEDIEICGGGSIVGDLYSTVRTEEEQHGHCITIRGCKNIRVHDILLTKAYGDGIYIGAMTTNSESIDVYNVQCKDNWRQGISITSGEEITIRNCSFVDIAHHSPSAGIDIELEPNCIVRDVSIYSCYFKDCHAAVYAKRNTNATWENSIVESITIENCSVDFSIQTCNIFELSASCVSVKNTKVKCTGTPDSDTRAVFFTSSEKHGSNITIENVGVDAENYYLYYYNSTEIQNLRMSEIRCLTSKGIHIKKINGVKISNSSIKGALILVSQNNSNNGSISLDNCIFDASLLPDNYLGYGLSVNKAGVFAFSKYDVNFNNVTFVDSKASRSYDRDCAFLQIRRSENIKGNVTLIFGNTLYKYAFLTGTSIASADADINLDLTTKPYPNSSASVAIVSEIVNVLSSSEVRLNNTLEYTNKVVTDNGLLKYRISPFVYADVTNLPLPSASATYDRKYVTALQREVLFNGNKWIESDGATASVARSGETASRPTGSNIYVGFMYMDTTLGKPVYWNGTAWVDATGATV